MARKFQGTVTLDALSPEEFVAYHDLLLEIQRVEAELVGLRLRRRHLLDMARGRARSYTGSLPPKAKLPIDVICGAIALRYFGMQWFEIAQRYDVSEMQIAERVRRIERQAYARLETEKAQ